MEEPLDWRCYRCFRLAWYRRKERDRLLIHAAFQLAAEPLSLAVYAVDISLIGDRVQLWARPSTSRITQSKVREWHYSNPECHEGSLVAEIVAYLQAVVSAEQSAYERFLAECAAEGMRNPRLNRFRV